MPVNIVRYIYIYIEREREREREEEWSTLIKFAIAQLFVISVFPSLLIFSFMV